MEYTFQVMRICGQVLCMGIVATYWEKFQVLIVTWMWMKHLLQVP